MSIHTPITASPTLTFGEFAEAEERDYEAEREDAAWNAVRDAAAWNRNVQRGDWSHADWLEYTGQSLADYMPASPDNCIPARPMS